MGVQKSRNIKVLYVDDDSDDCLIFSEALNSLNIPHDLNIAHNGVEGIAAASENKPDIIFLDINMPLMCGKECLKQIRSNENLKAIPVVIFSTSNSPSDIDEVHDHGANLYVIKPDSFEEIINLLKLTFSLYKAKKIFNTTRIGFVVSDFEKI
jgi:CheY-like chemotaxis protein